MACMFPLSLMATGVNMCVCMFVIPYSPASHMITTMTLMHCLLPTPHVQPPISLVLHRPYSHKYAVVARMCLDFDANLPSMTTAEKLQARQDIRAAIKGWHAPPADMAPVADACYIGGTHAARQYGINSAVSLDLTCMRLLIASGTVQSLKLNLLRGCLSIVP